MLSTGFRLPTSQDLLVRREVLWGVTTAVSSFLEGNSRPHQKGALRAGNLGLNEELTLRSMTIKCTKQGTPFLRVLVKRETVVLILLLEAWLPPSP